MGPARPYVINQTTAITSAATIAVTLLAVTAFTVDARQQQPVNNAVTCTVSAKAAEDGVEQVELLRICTADCGSFRIAAPILVDVQTREELHRWIEIGQTYMGDIKGDRIEFLGLVPSNIVATSSW